MATYLRVSASAEPGVEDMSDGVVGGGGYVTRSTAQARTGSASFLFSDGGSAVISRMKDGNVTARYANLAFAFRLKTRPSSGEYGVIVYGSAGAGLSTILSLSHDSSGYLELVDALAGGTAQGTSPSTYSLDTWYYAVIEEDYVVATNHDITVRTYDVNGTAIESWTDDGSMSDIGSIAGFGMGTCWTNAAHYGGGSECYVDDIALWVHTSSPTVPVRPMHAYLNPDAAGGHSAWTGYRYSGADPGSKLACIDEDPLYDGNDRIYDSTGYRNNYESYGHEACGITDTIHGVEAMAYGRRTAGTSSYLKLGMNQSGTSQVKGSYWVPGTSWEYERYFRATDVNGNDWTAANLDASESLIHHLTSSTSEPEIAMMGLVACYDGGTEAAAFTPRVIGPF